MSVNREHSTRGMADSVRKYPLARHLPVIRNMQRRLIPLVLLAMTFIAGCTAQPDRILLKEEAGNNYCHMKIETYGDPKMPTEREVVDYYGPCDERPTRK